MSTVLLNFILRRADVSKVQIDGVEPDRLITSFHCHFINSSAELFHFDSKKIIEK